MPKLAEALVERKGLQDRLMRLQTRLAANAKVQEGEMPDEVPVDLLAEAERTLAEIKRLTIAINRTNSQTALPTVTSGDSGNGRTIMEAIAERDRLNFRKSLLDSLGNAARVEPNRGYGTTRNEVKWRSTVDVATLQKEIDSVAQTYRLLDTHIQEANWLTDLIEN